MQTPIEKYIAKVEEMKFEITPYSENLEAGMSESEATKTWAYGNGYVAALSDIQSLLPELIKEVEKESIERAIEVVRKENARDVWEEKFQERLVSALKTLLH